MFVFSQYFFLAFTTFRQKALPFILSFSGILIGMITLVLVMGITEGNRKEIQKMLENLGADLLWVQFPEGLSILESQKFLSLPYLEAAAPVSTWVATDESDQKVIYGVTEAYFKIRSFTLLRGRFLHALDQQFQSPVCVMEGGKNQDNCQLDGVLYKVVGRVGPKFSGFEKEERLYVPLSAGHGSLNQVYLKLSPTLKMEQKRALITQFVSLHWPKAQAQVLSSESLIKTSRELNHWVFVLALLMTATTLFTGGLGIMNVLLISVKDRTKEIGIRKAVGASQKQILVQFLTEGTVISTLGGSIGIIIGFGSLFLLHRAWHVPIGLTPTGVILMGFLIVGMGIFFSFYPALHAARQSAAESLRG